MSDYFTLNIYTPGGVVVRGLKCESLIIPTVTGVINVLPGHTHILGQLSTGVMTAVTGMGHRHFSCTAGLVKVLKNEITVLSYTTEKAEDIDIERAKSAKAKAESRLHSKEMLSNPEYIKFQRKLERAVTRIQLAKMKH